MKETKKELRELVAFYKDACIRESYEVEQILGRALGYPWYKDDQKNFPGTTEADGVCVGDHVPASLAMEAASKIERLTRERNDYMATAAYGDYMREEIKSLLTFVGCEHGVEDPPPYMYPEWIMCALRSRTREAYNAGKNGLRPDFYGVLGDMPDLQPARGHRWGQRFWTSVGMGIGKWASRHYGRRATRAEGASEE